MGSLNSFAGTTCLVTGGLGFIGSNMANSLAAAGAPSDTLGLRADKPREA